MQLLYFGIPLNPPQVEIDFQLRLGDNVLRTRGRRARKDVAMSRASSWGLPVRFAVLLSSSLSCLAAACTDESVPSDAPAEPDGSLRSADGRRIPYAEVMTLCSQCHGSQATAFAHGAHGGMTGFWDLSRGPQMKNNCIDCHDPHAPQFPKMVVEFKPRDRFLEGEAAHDDHE